MPRAIRQQSSGADENSAVIFLAIKEFECFERYLCVAVTEGLNGGYRAGNLPVKSVKILRESIIAHWCEKSSMQIFLWSPNSCVLKLHEGRIISCRLPAQTNGWRDLIDK